MIEVLIPGKGSYQIEHLVCDVNGTLAVDGVLNDNVLDAFSSLQHDLKLHLVTADTHGRQSQLDEQFAANGVKVTTTILENGGESDQKRMYVRKLGAESTAAVGQGANDAGMLEESVLGLCVLSREGSAVASLMSADLVLPDVLAAVEILKRPTRITASLRT